MGVANLATVRREVVDYVAWSLARLGVAGVGGRPGASSDDAVWSRAAGRGRPSTPQISYGNWGFFDEMDYAGIDDATEIWWDASVRAEDERGQVGTGAWRRSHGGTRFTPQDAPTPAPFTDADSAATVLDRLPAEDRPPDYPPPRASPAAGH